jgi:DNA-binding FrmR family transcriptional regulator
MAPDTDQPPQADTPLAEGLREQQLHQRLARIEGQVRGIAQMLEAGRGRVDVLQQIHAARNALDAVGVVLVEEYLHDIERRGGLDRADAEELRAAVELVLR